MAPNNLIAALEELARKRHEITSAIVTLASVTGVDAAPYLDAPVAVTDTEVDAVVAGLRQAAKRTKEPTPPRPQRPASPSTNGTRANKVRGDKPSAILDALKRGPVKPSELGHLLGMSAQGAMYHVKGLAAAGEVTISGKREQRRVALA